MSKVDEWLAKIRDRRAVRPCVQMSNGVDAQVGDDGTLNIYDDGSISIRRHDIQYFVDWVIDTYDITPTGFERKGGA